MCCDSPCLIPHWMGEIYGFLCINCRAFTPN